MARIESEAKALIVGSNIRTYINKEKKEVMLFSLAIVQNGQAANIDCDETAYTAAQSLMMQFTTLRMVYNDQYSKVSITGVWTDKNASFGYTQTAPIPAADEVPFNPAPTDTPAPANTPAPADTPAPVSAAQAARAEKASKAG